MRILNDEWHALSALENDYHFPFHRVDPRAAQPDEALYRELLDGMMQDALIDLLSGMPMDRIPTLPSGPPWRGTPSEWWIRPLRGFGRLFQRMSSMESPI